MLDDLEAFFDDFERTAIEAQKTYKPSPSRIKKYPSSYTSLLTDELDRVIEQSSDSVEIMNSEEDSDALIRSSLNPHSLFQSVHSPKTPITKKGYSMDSITHRPAHPIPATMTKFSMLSVKQGNGWLEESVRVRHDTSLITDNTSRPITAVPSQRSEVSYSHKQKSKRSIFQNAAKSTFESASDGFTYK